LANLFIIPDQFPLLTPKIVLVLCVCMLQDSTNAKELRERDRDEGDLGPVYSFQWRHYGAEYRNMHDYDMYQSRRIIMCAWNLKGI
uniref:Thymidylate synthase n=1 Tax=Oncorhynchus kisutch TaxID=8019 RepID=A0A8C7GU33_ONCKI